MIRANYGFHAFAKIYPFATRPGLGLLGFKPQVNFLLCTHSGSVSKLLSEYIQDAYNSILFKLWELKNTYLFTYMHPQEIGKSTTPALAVYWVCNDALNCRPSKFLAQCAYMSYFF
jgi:hypothetical protein